MTLQEPNLFKQKNKKTEMIINQHTLKQGENFYLLFYHKDFTPCIKEIKICKVNRIEKSMYLVVYHEMNSFLQHHLPQYLSFTIDDLEKNNKTFIETIDDTHINLLITKDKNIIKQKINEIFLGEKRKKRLLTHYFSYQYLMYLLKQFNTLLE